MCEAFLFPLTFATLLVAILLLLPAPGCRTYPDSLLHTHPPGTNAALGESFKFIPSAPNCVLFQGGAVWCRDLTEEGVEPNPGPGKKKGGNMTKTIVVVPQNLKKKKSSVPQAPRKERSAGSGSGSTGRSLGSKLGGWVGDMAQKAVMAITGFGDYKVSANTLVTGGSPPAFAAGKHMTKVCHREFVMNVTSSTGFSIGAAYNISPITALFPWLSQMALMFEQYAIRGMIVEFKSTSGTAIASTNTALGSVIIATQYNVLAPAFSTQVQMEAYEYCTSCKPAESMIHPIECAPGLSTLTELYMDSGLSGDPRFENLGTVYVATTGQQAAGIVIGELWVSYEIDLIRPKLFSGVSSAGLSAHMWANGLNNALSTYANSPFTGLQVSPGPSSGSDLPLSIITSPVNGAAWSTISFPSWVNGKFWITVSWIANSSSASNASPTVTALQNCGLASEIQGGFSGNNYLSYPGVFVATGGTSNFFCLQFVLRVGPSNTPNLPALVQVVGQQGTVTGNCTSVDLRVVQISTSA